MANELLTYGDASVVRSVQEEIEILTPEENYLLKNLPKTTAKAMLHQWQTDTLDTAGSAAVPEYQAFSAQALTTPTLTSNLVEQVYKNGAVSEAQMGVMHYSGQDEFARQVQKKMLSWANSAEFDLVRSSLVSGQSGVTQRMNGAINTLTTNVTAQTSGTIFSESILIGLLKNTWDNSNGDAATDLFVGSFLKSRISSFTAGITKYEARDAAAAGTRVQVYESDYGTVNIHLHRYVQLSTDSTSRILGLNINKFYLAYLEGGEAKMTEYAKTGTSRDFVINGYLTLENRNEQCSFFSSGYLKAI